MVECEKMRGEREKLPFQRDSASYTAVYVMHTAVSNKSATFRNSCP